MIWSYSRRSTTPSVVLWLSLLLAALVLAPQPAEAAASPYWEGTYFCKCVCFAANYTILPIYTPANPEKPCLTCTKQWCLDRKLPICVDADIGGTDPDTGTGKEGDVEARCFQRYFPRDQIVVTLFLLVVFGLLLGAAVRGRMEKAGMSFTRPGSRWWEIFFPSRIVPPADSVLFDTRPESRGSRSPRSPLGAGAGMYIAISDRERL